jgi:hypothetical protein
MADKTPQTYANHPKYDPPFHFFVLPVLATTVLLAMWNVAKGPRFDTIWTLILALAWFVAAFKIRLYALGVQDRLIRLEERLRMASVLPGLRSRIGELTASCDGRIAIASDAELPALVENAGWQFAQRGD